MIRSGLSGILLFYIQPSLIIEQDPNINEDKSILDILKVEVVDGCLLLVIRGVFQQKFLSLPKIFILDSLLCSYFEQDPAQKQFPISFDLASSLLQTFKVRLRLSLKTGVVFLWFHGFAHSNKCNINQQYKLSNAVGISWSFMIIAEFCIGRMSFTFNLQPTFLHFLPKLHFSSSDLQRNSSWEAVIFALRSFKAVRLISLVEFSLSAIVSVVFFFQELSPMKSKPTINKNSRQTQPQITKESGRGPEISFLANWKDQLFPNPLVIREENHQIMKQTFQKNTTENRQRLLETNQLV